MQLDDWKEAWAAHCAKLERSLAIDERLLREALLGKTRRALAPWTAWRAVEVAFGAAALLAAVPVLAAHTAEPRYLVAAGAVAAFAAAFTALAAHQLALGLQLDHGAPVTALQRDVARLRRAEYRATKWAFLGGVLLWLPAALVAFEAVTGFAALARVDLAWLAANLGFGVAVLAAGHALSRRYVERDDLGPRARRFVDALTGRGLRAAASRLDELARFVREDATP